MIHAPPRLRHATFHSFLRSLIPAAFLLAGAAAPPDPTPITIDGDLSDWPPNVAAIADADYLYIRTSVDGPSRTLQAMQDRTLELWIDADSSSATGAREPAPRAAAALGVDLEVRFSPLTDGKIGNGVAVSVPITGGERVKLGHADAGVVFLPTYAAHEYEIRLSRRAKEVPGGLAGGALAGEGHATLMLVMLDGAGKVKGWSDPFGVDLPAASGARPRTVLPTPAKGADELRVMTWNVLKSAPMSKPAPFARTIKALAPDIILFQEWAEGDQSAIEGWLSEQVGGDWHVLKSADGDVAIASRYSLSAVGPERIRLEEGQGARPVRFVAAMVATPLGQVIAGTAHLKCCGYIDSDEDVRRLAEAGAINQAMKSAFSGAAGAAGLRVIGGDMNLVGSRPPLDALRAGLDVDGSDLDVVDAMVWGQRAMYTWSDATNDFSPGRLDYLMVSDQGAEVVRSFVFDPTVLSDSALIGLGLEPGAAGASDHLPVVMDIKGR